MKTKKFLQAFLTLFGYRIPKQNFPPKKNEIRINVILFLSYVLYYYITLQSLIVDVGISNIAFFSWFISMTITAIDNIKRLISGMNRYKKLTNLRKKKAKRICKYQFHNGFYMSILFIEVLFGVSALIIHMISFNENLSLVERCLMMIGTIVFMFQSLIHTLVDIFGLEDIEEVE